MAMRSIAKLNSYIRMLVDVPNPLSKRRTGMVYSKILEVAHKRTPAPMPKRKRPRHINLKLIKSDRAEPITAKILK